MEQIEGVVPVQPPKDNGGGNLNETVPFSPSQMKMVPSGYFSSSGKRYGTRRSSSFQIPAFLNHALATS